MSTLDELIALNPFPGLRSFATNEADRFFGRRQQIVELAERLDEAAFLAVAGSSGCGKSSLVLAGLLSELQRRTEAGNETLWRAVVMRPGSQPIANLADRLSSVIGGSGSDESRAGALYGRLRLGGLGLVEAVRLARLEAHTRVLVVVDQFEEIFRFKRMIDADEASAFVKLLLNAARDPESPVTVVITLRSEMLGYCADFRDLPETINRGQYLVPKLTREQRKQAIVGPIELRGFQIAPRLVQRLLNDVSDDFDDLPVMQHALARTWNRWAQACQGSKPIDLEDYEAVGTSKQALSKHADEAFGSLTGLAPVVEKLFRALTERVAEGHEIRRPLVFDLLCQVVGAGREQVEQVVERFRRSDTAFLMPGPGVSLSSDPVIDISHESLIRQWQRLRGWAQAEAESRAILLRVVEAARRYRADEGSLWRGPELKEALKWRQSAQPTPAWVGLYTNDDGIAACQSANAFLAESRRRSWLRSAALAAVPIAVIPLVIAFQLSKQSDSRARANEALLVMGQDPAQSAHLALDAVKMDQDNEQGVYALRQSLATLEFAHAERILDLGTPVLDAQYTPDGSRLVTASGKTVTIFDSKTFEPIKQISRDKGVLRAWLIDKNNTLVTQTGEDGRAQIQRIDGSAARPISCKGGEKNLVYAVTVSPDDHHVALGCYNGDVLVWDATDPAAPPKHAYSHRVKEDMTVTALTFSADGKFLATGDVDGTVNIWKLGYPTAWIHKGAPGTKGSPLKHEKAIRDIGFYRDDPGLLVTGADDNKAIVWTLDLERRRLGRDKKNKLQRWPLKHERPVLAAKFTAPRGGEFPVFTVSGKNVQFWVDLNADPKQVRAHDDWIVDANASPDGELLVTASADGTGRIWSTRSETPIAVLRGHTAQLNRAVFSPDGTRVITASGDGSVRVWRFRAPRLLASSKRWVYSAAFEPGGIRIAVGGEDQAGILELNDFAGSSMPVRHDLPAARNKQISGLTWSKNRKFLVGVSSTYDIYSESKLVLWDVASKLDITPEWFKDWSTAVFNPETDELLTVSAKGKIAVWGMKSLEATDPQAKLELGDDSWRRLAAMSPDGKWIAAVNADNIVELWSRDKPQAPPRELVGHDGEIMSLQFSRNSKWLLTASKDRTALLWPTDRADRPKELKGGHSAALSSAAFDPSGERVVTGSADGTIGVWNAEKAMLLASLRWHSEGVNSVEFSPDGKWILSASDDGTVKLGQCEACALPLEELRKRVPDLAKVLDPK